MKRTTRILAFILSAFMVLAFTGCDSASNTSESKGTESAASTASANNDNSESKADDNADTTELKTVKVGVPGYDSNPLLDGGRLADKLGYFDEELSAAGYKYELTTFQEAGPAINEAYASGQLDLAVYGDFPATVARSNGNDIKVIGLANSQMNIGVLVQNDSDIKTPKDLEGKKVIVGIGTNFQEYWSHLVDEFDIDESKVDIVNVVSDAVTVFSTGEADALLTLYYNAVKLENDGTGKILIDTTQYPEHASQWLITGRTAFLEENPDAAVAFLKAYERAQQYAVEHPDELYEALSSESVGVEVYKKAYGYDPTFEYLKTKITDENIEKFNYLNNFLTSNQLIKEEINLDDFIDYSYYKLAFGE